MQDKQNDIPLLILSDLLGWQSDEWEQQFRKTAFGRTVEFIDCKDIAGIPTTLKNKEKIHQHFLTYGISNAVQWLLSNYQQKIDILSFSIGGTIAWKAILQGLSVNQYIAVSATRLRKETECIACKTILIYGEKDVYQPQKEWFEKMNIHPIIIENEGHEVYRHKTFLEKNIASHILH